MLGGVDIKNTDIENGLTLLIPKSLSENLNISNYAVTTYCILQALSIPTKLPLQCITCHQIIFYLTGETCQQRNRITEYIKLGINELTDNGTITKLQEFSKHYILDCTNLWIDSDNGSFTKITFHEVTKIFTIRNVNPFSLLRFFILLIGTLSGKITVYLENGKYKNCVVGNFTVGYLARLSGISDRTVVEYNRLLEEHRLIYIYRQKDFILGEDKSIKQLTNVYGRYTDSEYIDMFAQNQQQYMESYRYIKNNHEKANRKRRYAQMYQQLIKGKGEKYTEQEILDIYDYVISENRKFERLYEKSNHEDYLDKIRDTDIFNKYDFITREIRK